MKIPSIVEKAISFTGNVDVLINNGGISQRSLAQESNFDVYEHIFTVNQVGTIKLTQTLLPHFIKRNSGHFITVTSIAGVAGLPYRTAYCASKFAVEGYFAALRVELSPYNVNITMIRPGAVKTNVGKNALLADGSSKGSSDATIEDGLSAELVAHKIYTAYLKKNSNFIYSIFVFRALFLLCK